MKTVIAFVLFFANVSFAGEIVRGRPAPTGVPGVPVQGQLLAAHLTGFNIDRREHFANANKGSISIDVAKRTVTLSLWMQPVCPPTAICAAFVGSFVQFELPLVKRTVDPRCGSVTYTAARDQRPVDGALQQIDVIDNTRFSCPSRVRMAPTFVSLRTVPARFSHNEERASSFFAAPLSNTLQAIPFTGQPLFTQ